MKAILRKISIPFLLIIFVVAIIIHAISSVIRSIAFFMLLKRNSAFIELMNAFRPEFDITDF